MSETQHKRRTPAPESEVGYGRPPKNSQFKPGRSGNPKGRPRASKDIASVLRDQLAEKVPVREGGKAKLMTRGAIAVRRMVTKLAETGDPKLFRAVREIAPDAVFGSAEAVLQDLVKDHPRRNEAELLAWFKATIIEEHELNRRALIDTLADGGDQTEGEP